MKKLNYFAMMGAIALTGLVTFTACSSSEDAIEPNPDYNPETNAVKTDFTFSLQGNIVKTRMSGDNVQSTGTINKFLGMTNIKLVPFQTESAVAATNTDNILAGKMIFLDGDIPAGTTGSATEANKIYTNVNVPVGTNRFILYGEAGLEEGFDHGALTVGGLGSETATNVNGVTFTPKRINTSPTTLDGYRKSKNLIALLNKVANTSVGSGTDEVTWKPGEKQTTVYSLAAMFGAFSKTTTGSSQKVKCVLQDLYNGLETLATGTDPGHDLAAAIRTNITAALSYEDGTTINCAANTVSGSVLTLSDDYTGYPANINLPSGAARLNYTPTDGFTDLSVEGNANIAPLASYVYPANLQYFVNSDIKAANTKKLNDGSWASLIEAYASDPTVVSGDTRSILLNKQIQYGVCRLDVTVTKMDKTKYFDHSGTEVTIPEGGYTLTGIVIGNQKAADWSFHNASGTSYTVYDKMIAGGSTPIAVTASAATTTNYTLLLESVDDVDVNIALEFVNNGAAFEGQDGTIHSGDTFYLVGTLTPSQGGENYGDGEGKTKKVFTQDFTTTANFTIASGAKSDDPTTYSGSSAGLGNAFLGLPDLSVPQLELGFSVDLGWTPGLTFNTDI